MPKSVTLSYKEAMRRLAEMPESAVDGTYVNKPRGRPRTKAARQFNPANSGFSLAILDKHFAAAQAVIANPNSQSALDNLAASVADYLADRAAMQQKRQAANAKLKATLAAKPRKPKWDYVVTAGRRKAVMDARCAAEQLGIKPTTMAMLFSRSGGRPLQKLRTPADAPAYILEVARVLHNASAMPKPEKRDRRTKGMKMDNQVGGDENPAGGA